MTYSPALFVGALMTALVRKSARFVLVVVPVVAGALVAVSVGLVAGAMPSALAVVRMSVDRLFSLKLTFSSLREVVSFTLSTMTSVVLKSVAFSVESTASRTSSARGRWMMLTSEAFSAFS